MGDTIETVNLILKHNPYPLGDQIDAVFLANMISRIDGVRVNLISSSPKIEYLNNTFGFANVIVNKLNTKAVKTHEWHAREWGFYINYSKQLDTIPLQTNIEMRNIDLPQKFVTTQWDAGLDSAGIPWNAGQEHRNVGKWDSERIPRIEQYYKDKGYEIVGIGGQSNIRDLKDIVYTLSCADLHVGADSGMMHVAKFLLPIENIHVYINIRNSYNDIRFPDNWSVSFMAREIFRRGAQMNYCEKPHQGKIQYFKDVEIYNT